MGLRFRKSVTLCKGVRLNFGKTGVSISSGVPGFRKTYNFNTGRTTTSVGIPGTGIYYVDTKNPSKNKTEKKSGGFFSELFCDNQTSSPAVANNTKRNGFSTNDTPTNTSKPVYVKPSTVTDGPSNIVKPANNDDAPQLSKNDRVETSPADVPVIEQPISTVQVSPNTIVGDVEEKKPEEITYATINAIFENCDVAIDWVDVISHKNPTSDDINPETWKYLHKKAVDVFEGNIDALLEIISTVNPYDDLLEYTENYEFGTDDPTIIEVEFSIIEDGTEKLKKGVLEDYFSALAIRVARDTFALLPVEKTLVHVNYKAKEVLASTFSRETFNTIDLFGKDASDIIKQLAQ